MSQKPGSIVLQYSGRASTVWHHVVVSDVFASVKNVVADVVAAAASVVVSSAAVTVEEVAVEETLEETGSSADAFVVFGGPVVSAVAPLGAPVVSVMLAGTGLQYPQVPSQDRLSLQLGQNR